MNFKSTQFFGRICFGNTGFGFGLLPDTVRRALQYMDDHLRQELRVEQLAGGIGVSVNTLERHFKAGLGVTPLEMLRRKRLFLSMMYLKSGSGVTEAALKSGFSDYSNYIQLFRKQFGMTPGQYGKMTKNEGGGTI